MKLQNREVQTSLSGFNNRLNYYLGRGLGRADEVENKSIEMIKIEKREKTNFKNEQNLSCPWGNSMV